MDSSLWVLLESCQAAGMDFPKATAHITATHGLTRYIAEVELAVGGVPLAQDAVDRAFTGLPVKQVWHLCKDWAAKITDLQERDLALRRYADKREAREERRIPWRDPNSLGAAS